MIEKITGFTEYLRKVPAAFLVAIIAALSIILFVPDSLASTLSIDTFREQYRSYLGPSLILTVVFVVARFYYFICMFLKKRNQILQQYEALLYLTSQEKGYLAEFILGDLNTIYVGMDDGVMLGLVAKGITYQASSIGHALHGFPFNLNDWARAYLVMNPQLLQGAVGAPQTPEERTFGNRGRDYW